MKTIYLIRHAKSDWDNPLLRDIERPLNNRGYADANTMGRRLKTPGLIISSPAVRALSTALIFARQLNYAANNICIKQELYDTSVKDYLSVIKTIPDTIDTVFLFGHNPIISDTAESLCKGIPNEMPTCAIAGISFAVDAWSSIKQKSGELILFDYPKKEKEQ
jgi:phosphohistidine phosphatase